jgi:hypothetical protein
VYRPADFEFPRARGRDGIEFRRDGTFIEWQIGPTDASRGATGRWRSDGSNRVRVTFEMNPTSTPRALEIIQCDEQILIVRRQQSRE